MQSNIQRHKRIIIEVRLSKEEFMRQIKWKKKKKKFKSLTLKHKKIYPSSFNIRQTLEINIIDDLYGGYSNMNNN